MRRGGESSLIMSRLVLRIYSLFSFVFFLSFLFLFS